MKGDIEKDFKESINEAIDAGYLISDGEGTRFSPKALEFLGLEEMPRMEDEKALVAAYIKIFNHVRKDGQWVKEH